GSPVGEAPASPAFLDAPAAETEQEPIFGGLSGGGIDEGEDGEGGEGGDPAAAAPKSGQEPDEGADDTDETSAADKEGTILVHTYTTAAANGVAAATATAATAMRKLHDKNGRKEVTLMGVGVPRRRFAAWVHYYLEHMTNEEGGREAAKGMRPPSLKVQPDRSSNVLDRILERATTEEIDQEEDWEARLPSVRDCWMDGRLICDHTNLLGSRSKPVAGGNSQGEDDPSAELSEEEAAARKDEEEAKMKAEQFRDALGSYADRMAGIVEDESSDAEFSPSPNDRAGGIDQLMPSLMNLDGFSSMVDNFPMLKSPSASATATAAPARSAERAEPRWDTTSGLRGWIEEEYGAEATHKLEADVLLRKSEEVQLQTFRTFLEWFRSKFPYYHDRCDACGASCKDDPTNEKEGRADETNAGLEHRVAMRTDVDASHEPEQIEVPTEKGGANAAEVDGVEGGGDDDDDDDDAFSFLGYVRPSPPERLGNASRTELYRCRSCDSYTRFPRYNRALWVTSSRRGRCGEYSMLLYRMLRALGYDEVRWVVDWADHVWVEARLGSGLGNGVRGGGGGMGG
ncbi:hypothetical protein ACHAWF_004878, partial [Thalassiosira exigua]